MLKQKKRTLTGSVGRSADRKKKKKHNKDDAGGGRSADTALVRGGQGCERKPRNRDIHT